MLSSFPFMPEGIVSGQIREKAVPGQRGGTDMGRENEKPGFSILCGI